MALAYYKHQALKEILVHIQIQLTVVYLLPHGLDLWRATLTQQRVQWCSTAVIQVWFLREG